jgi:hypothetical protein
MTVLQLKNLLDAYDDEQELFIFDSHECMWVPMNHVDMAHSNVDGLALQNVSQSYLDWLDEQNCE